MLWTYVYIAAKFQIPPALRKNTTHNTPSVEDSKEFEQAQE